MLNTIILMGRLTRDPELKTTRSGVSVTEFTIAVDRDFTRQGEEKQTDFFDVIAWRNTAEFVSRYMTKGQLIAVQGSMQSRKWQDKNGSNRISWEVQADNVYFAESKRDDCNNSHPEKELSSGSDAPREIKSREDAAGVPLTGNSSTEGFVSISPNDDLPF